MIFLKFIIEFIFFYVLRFKFFKFFICCIILFELFLCLLTLELLYCYTLRKFCNVKAFFLKCFMSLNLMNSK